VTADLASLTGIEVPTGLFIGGEWRPGSAGTLGVTDPATEDTLVEIANGTPEDAIAAVGAAGVLVAPLYSVYPTAGLQFVLLSYVVVVLGGLGDMLGAMIGSLIVAAVEVAGSYVFGVAWKEIFYFLLFILVLVFRPAGLFGQRGAETLGV